VDVDEDLPDAGLTERADDRRGEASEPVVELFPSEPSA
jgi:hypothetical protein